MRSEKHLKFGAGFLPRPTDIQEKEKTKEKNSRTGHMLKICNFIFKESERNGRVLVLFSYKEVHKTTRRTEKVKFYRVANKEKGGNQSLRGRKGSTVEK